MNQHVNAIAWKIQAKCKKNSRDFDEENCKCICKQEDVANCEKTPNAKYDLDKCKCNCTNEDEERQCLKQIRDNPIKAIKSSTIVNWKWNNATSTSDKKCKCECMDSDKCSTINKKYIPVNKGKHCGCGCDPETAETGPKACKDKQSKSDKSEWKEKLYPECNCVCATTEAACGNKNKKSLKIYPKPHGSSSVAQFKWNKDGCGCDCTLTKAECDKREGNWVFDEKLFLYMFTIYK